MIIKRGRAYNKVTKAAIERHVENLRTQDAAGKIQLCGPLQGYPGEEAEALCKLEPLVAEGFATYTLATLHVAGKDNNYLL